MKQCGFAGPHRVLVAAKGRETVANELAQSEESLSARDGPIKVLRLSR